MEIWNRNIEHFKSFGKYILERLLCISIGLLIIIGITCLLFFKAEIINPQQVESQQILIFGISLENLSIWLGVVAIIITAFWSTFQFHKNKTHSQQEKASDIAKSFANDLTFKCSIIYNVLKNSEILNFLKIEEKQYDNFKVFNTNEIRAIYKDDNIINKYNEKMKSANLDQIYYRILDSMSSFSKFSTLTAEKKEYSVEEARELLQCNNISYPFHFHTLIIEVLNELEFLCMNLSSQAAGSKFVYQSLHQVFLRTIRLLCIEISKSNNNFYSDKYYTNIIYVYNEWTKLYIKDLKKEQKQKEKANKILNPKIKTV